MEDNRLDDVATAYDEVQARMEADPDLEDRVIRSQLQADKRLAARKKKTKKKSKKKTSAISDYAGGMGLGERMKIDE